MYVSVLTSFIARKPSMVLHHWRYGFGSQLCKTISSTQSKLKVQNDYDSRNYICKPSHLAPNKPKVFIKARPKRGPNPTRKVRPNLQLCLATNFLSIESIKQWLENVSDLQRSRLPHLYHVECLICHCKAHFLKLLTHNCSTLMLVKFW